jgi:hypothetical protein
MFKRMPLERVSGAVQRLENATKKRSIRINDITPRLTLSGYLQNKTVGVV